MTESANIFGKLLQRQPIFRGDREILRSSHIPQELPHRQDEVQNIASILVTALRGSRPSNILVFGKTGTGKTASVRYLRKEIVLGQEEESVRFGTICATCQGFLLEPHADCEEAGDGRIERICPACVTVTQEAETCPSCSTRLRGVIRCRDCDSPFRVEAPTCPAGHPSPLQYSRVEMIYINCEVEQSPYGVLARVGNHLTPGEDVIPKTGWGMDRVYSKLKDLIDRDGRIVVVVLDEIDRLVKRNGDELLYLLAKVNDDLSRPCVALLGISNDAQFAESLSAPVRSRLGDEKVFFEPYGATQLRDILANRAALVFDDGVLADGTLSLCAALAANEDGDARLALDLLRVSAELAERSGDTQVTENHVREAKNKIELDMVAKTITALPAQSKLVLLSILRHEERGDGRMTTGEVYEEYRELALRTEHQALTQRRISQLLAGLDTQGIINAKVKSFGSGGLTREIHSNVSPRETRRLIFQDPSLEPLKRNRNRHQTTLMPVQGQE